MASNQEEYIEQLQLLQERFPEESKDKLLRQLHKHNGDYYQVPFFIIYNKIYQNTDIFNRLVHRLLYENIVIRN